MATKPEHLETIPVAEKPSRVRRRHRHQRTSKSSSNRASWFVLVALLIFSPLAFGAVEYWSIATLEFVAVVLAATWIIGGLRGGSLRLQFNALAASSVGLMLWVSAQLALGHTLDRAATRDSLLLLFSYLLVYLAVSNEQWSSRWIRRLAMAISTIGFAIAVFGIVQLFSWNGKIYWLREVDVGIPFGPYVNHNHFAGLMEMTLPTALGIALSERFNNLLRMLFIFFALIMGMATLLSLSRGGMLSLSLSLVALVYIYRQRQRTRPALLAVGGLALLVVASVAYLDAEPVLRRLLTLQNLGQETSFTSRLQIAGDTLQLIRDHPFSGTGLGTYALAIPRYISHYTSLTWDKAHNDYLQLLSEVGLAGFSFAVWWIVGFFRRAVKTARNESHPLWAVRIGAFCGCLAVLFHSLVDFNLQIPANALFFVVLAALVTRADAPRPGEVRPDRAEPQAVEEPVERGAPAAS